MIYVNKHEYLDSTVPLELDFKQSVQIQTEAFKNSNIKSLSFDNLETIIETDAFENCNNLTTIKFNSMKLIANGSFSMCKNISDVSFDNKSFGTKLNYTIFDTCKIKNLTINNVHIGSYAFINCKIENITLTNCILDSNCFYNINGINSIWVEDSIITDTPFSINNSNKLSVKLINCDIDARKPLFYNNVIIDLFLDSNLIPKKDECLTDKEIARNISQQFPSCRIGNLFYNQNMFKEEHFESSKFINVEPINLDILLELKKSYKNVTNYYKKLEEIKEL